MITCNNPMLSFDFQLFWLVPREKVSDLLVVNLHVGNVNGVHGVPILLSLLALKNMNYGPEMSQFLSHFWMLKHALLQFH